MGTHTYTAKIAWTPQDGQTNADYRSYSCNWSAALPAAGMLHGSSDPAFRGDPTRVNPEDLFLTAISTCHMLWSLHLAARAVLEILSYTDTPTATMTESGEDGGRFTQVVLKPVVTLRGPDRSDLARRVHEDSHRACFVANSVSVPITVEDTAVFRSV